MKTPKFNTNQLVKIENKEQFEEIYHALRSAKNGISLDKWIKEVYRGYPSFPIYLEHFCSTIGFISNPNYGEAKIYEVLSFEEACKDNN